MRPCENGNMNRNENSFKTVRILELGDPVTLPGRHLDARNLQLPIGMRITTSRICICCGEPMIELDNSQSRNPNVCASCSSLADGMEEGNNTEVSHEILP
jgi:hypothetical protein